VSQALMMALIEGHEGAMNLISRLILKTEILDKLETLPFDFM
jgi:hypothetical protein